MSADYAPAEWIPTSHFWSGRGGNKPRWIIVHGTAGGGAAQDVARCFQSNDPPTSTHFVIGRDGHVVQCVAESDSAWGNGVVTRGHDPWWTPKLNPNFVTFSIEHCKPDTGNQSDLTQAQKEASFALIAHLCDKYNIPKRPADANGGIAGHHSIDPVNRSFCPGPYPWDELWGYLEGEGTVGRSSEMQRRRDHARRSQWSQGDARDKHIIGGGGRAALLPEHSGVAEEHEPDLRSLGRLRRPGVGGEGARGRQRAVRRGGHITSGGSRRRHDGRGRPIRLPDAAGIPATDADGKRRARSPRPAIHRRPSRRSGLHPPIP